MLQIPNEALPRALVIIASSPRYVPEEKERMQRLIETVRRGRVDLTSLLTHTSSLDDIGNAYNLFGERRPGVLKVAMRP